MRKSILASVVASFVALGFVAASGQAPATPRGVLSILHAGQPVNLKEAGGRFEIGVFEKGPAPLDYKVVEVGSDYIVVQDVVGVTETRIPIYSIKAVVRLKIGK